MAGRQIRRGTNAERVALGGLSVGEFGFETDTLDVYVGTASGDQLVGGVSQYQQVANKATSPVTVSAVEARGGILTNSGAAEAITLNLPAAVAGMHLTVFVKAAYVITIDPNGADRILNITSANGDYIVSDANIGTYIKLMCLETDKWDVMEMNGSWTEE